MSQRNTTEEKIVKSDSIYCNQLVNMLVNSLLKYEKKSLAYIIYLAMKKIQPKNRNKSNPLYVCCLLGASQKHSGRISFFFNFKNMFF